MKRIARSSRSALVSLFVGVALAACGGATANTSPPPSPVPPPPTAMPHQAVSAQPSANPVPTIAPIVSVGAPDPAEVKAQAAARELAAYKTAEPVFTRYCASCHQKGGKRATAKTLAHLDITTYPFSGHHAAEIGPKLRQVLGIGGGKATMPKGRPGIVNGGELDQIAAFCAAWDSAHPGTIVAPDND